MPAVLLCGGRGTRLDEDREKPLVPVDGRPMVGRVLDALADARVTRVVAVVSPHTPETADRLRGELTEAAAVSCTVLDGRGDGYVTDLNRGLDAVGKPAVTVAADLPLLRGSDVDAAIDAAMRPDTGGDACASGDARADTEGGFSARSVTVCVPAAQKRKLGVSVDTAFEHEDGTLAPSGLNVVGDDPDRILVSESRSLAINVNRPRDRAVARAVAAEHAELR
jgi:adenosylcobinamide-phosphate guanylyltransferase